jgi:hypothetical protein
MMHLYQIIFLYYIELAAAAAFTRQNIDTETAARDARSELAKPRARSAEK